jgi:hypothetical protein
MSDINREYIKTLSKIVEKIKKLQEQIKDISDIEKNLSFKNVVNSLEEFRKNIDVLKIVIDEELRTKTLKFENSLANLEGNISDTINKLKKEIEEIKFIWEKDKELGYKIQKSLSEVIKEIKEELDNLKETLRKYAEELKFTKEGLLKSPGIIGPSASGVEVLLNNQKKGVYSKLNFIEGANITFEISENKQEGRANIKINSTGGGGGGGGATTFLQLTDTPASYTTHGLKLVQVNSDEDALQFTPISSLLTAGNGISLSGTTNVTITNTGILSLTAGPGISISSGQNPTITNTGVLSLNSATGTLILQGTTNQVNINTSGNTITLSLPQNIHTQATPIFAGLTLKRSTAGNVFVIRNTSDTADTFTITDAGIVSLGTWQGTPIGISYGGTGATTASGARTNLGAAASGINTDITAIRGLNQQNAIQINPYGTASGNTGEIRFLELAANGTNYVGFKAPDNIASNIIWTLPNSDGTPGQVLTTNGSGGLIWTTVSGGGGGGGYTTIQEEGTPLTQRAIMNFIGAGLTAQDDATNLRTNIIWDRFLAERKAPFYYTDFLGPAGTTTVEPAYPFDFVAINSGTIAKIPGEPNHPGILRISSSTTANSGGYVLTEITAFRISGGEVFEIIFQPRVSGNANTTIRMGFLDTTSSTDATDGVYFELPANSLDIVGKTANNGVRTTSTTIATLTVNTWYRCRIEINNNATQANFYVYDENGTLLGSTSITTNIPTALGRETGAGFVATNSGTTATLLAYFDFMAVGYNGRELTR